MESACDMPVILYKKVSGFRKVSPSHTHSHHELYYLLDGETKYFVGNQIFSLVPGNLIFVPKGMIHNADSETCHYNERFLLSFDDSYVDAQLQPLIDILSEVKLITLPAERLAAVRELFDRIMQEYEQHLPYGEYLIRRYISEILVLLCRFRTSSPHPQAIPNQSMQEVISYINDHFAEDISLKTLSIRLSMNESHLSRKFKTCCGIGITEYLTQVRIHHAAQLLTQHRYSITEVSQKCGFNDSNYFASVFKRIEGITPLRYSKKFTEDGSAEPSAEYTVN